jgi:predicted phage terminase large subunit-like protein
MVITCNPDPDHKIRELIDWYLDDEGFPDPERDGKVRWFITRDGEFFWGNSSEELKEKFGDNVRPISFQFISALIYDNPPMLESNPDYLAFLEGLNPVDKAQLLFGNWDARPKGAKYFKREFLKEVDKVPLHCKSVRAWDKAGKERTVSYKNPDFTASCKMYKCRDGFYYITGDHHPDNYDDVTETGGRFCKSVGERDVTIRKQAEYDGSDTVVVFPVDPGASGLSEFQNSAKPLIETGYTVKKDPTPGNKSKLKRFEPFASAAEQGFVRIVKSTFSPKTYEALMKELEAFDGERSSTHRHDDWADAVASAFNFLAASKVHTALAIPDYSCPTKLSSF